MKQVSSVKWIPDSDLRQRWNDYVSAVEKREGRKHRGNQLLTEAVTAYLNAKSGGIPIPDAVATSPDAANTLTPWTREWIQSVVEFLSNTLASAEALLERGRKAIQTEAGHEKGVDDAVEKAAEIIRTAKDQLRSSGSIEGDRGGNQPTKRGRKRDG